MPSLTREQIVEIRDRHLPSQGESFNWSAFAQDVGLALLRAAAPGHERERVLCEARLISTERAYFEARPGFDTDAGRRTFRHGFDRGFGFGFELMTYLLQDAAMPSPIDKAAYIDAAAIPTELVKGNFP